jgi:hypothetical protein
MDRMRVMPGLVAGIHVFPPAGVLPHAGKARGSKIT